MPCLKEYGGHFVNRLNVTRKMAAGIYDTLLNGAQVGAGRNVYVLFNKKSTPKEFKSFLNYTKGQSYFKYDYCPEPDLLAAYAHCIVIEIPEKYFGAYDKFLQSKYSEMYNEQELKYLFSSKGKQEEYAILSKSNTALTKFKKTIEEEFGEKINTESVYNSEWELPLKKKEEIFNCTSEDRIFFNKDLDKVWK